jgi:hypothetical protein
MRFLRNLIGLRGAMSAHERRVLAILDASEACIRTGRQV